MYCHPDKKICTHIDISKNECITDNNCNKNFKCISGNNNFGFCYDNSRVKPKADFEPVEFPIYAGFNIYNNVYLGVGELNSINDVKSVDNCINYCNKTNKCNSFTFFNKNYKKENDKSIDKQKNNIGRCVLYSDFIPEYEDSFKTQIYENDNSGINIGITSGHRKQE
jgi:hypothetical protein